MHTILLYYKYTSIDNPEALMREQRKVCSALGLKGRIIIAREGINGTLEGLTENTEKYIEHMKSDVCFADVHWKKSVGTGKNFPRLSIKVRDEIVSAHLDTEDLDPNKITGTHLKPEELREWYESGKDFVVIDMRNDYEYEVGHFKDSINPGLKNFRDLPKVLPDLEPYKTKRVVTVCTGGVRCEKASGYLKSKGFQDVYQLDGGIVSYMERYPARDFQGSLYVFDDRISMHFDTKETHVVVGRCEVCQGQTENYANCQVASCNDHMLCCPNCLTKCQREQKLLYCDVCRKGKK